MVQEPVQSKSDIQARLLLNTDRLKGFGVERLGLFGSFVRGEAGAESDVDLFVEIELERKTLKNMVALSRFLHDLLGRKVELVTPASLNPFTGKHILNEVEYVAFAA
jgi:predicted nucleotidyltransferase